MKRYFTSPTFALLGLLGMTGCGGVSNALSDKKHSVEYYRIYDLKTQASKQVLGKAASDGLGQNTGKVSTTSPIPTSAEVPEKAGRFKVVDPLAGTKLGQLAASSGGFGLRMAECEGAVWTAKAVRTITGSNQLNLWTCLYPYKDGYHLDMYATFAKVEGGLGEITRQMAYAATGTPEEWTEKTFTDVIRQIHQQTGAAITYVEGYPDPGPLPWHDGGSQPAQQPSSQTKTPG